MKKLIFAIILLFSTSAFSINGEAQWKKDVTTHGKALTSQEWTKKITQPNYCRLNREYKLIEIGNISLSIFGKHPNEWLTPDYLKYINQICSIGIDSTYSTLTSDEKLKLFNEKADVYLHPERYSSVIPNILIFLIWFLVLFFVFKKFTPSYGTFYKNLYNEYMNRR